MTSPRERILASLRDGLLRGRLPADGGRAAGPTPETRPAPAVPEMADQFTAALTALSGHVHRASGSAAVAEIIGFRNVLIHGYDIVDRDAVWKAITVEVPALFATVTVLLAELDAATENRGQPVDEPPDLE